MTLFMVEPCKAWLRETSWGWEVKKHLPGQILSVSVCRLLLTFIECHHPCGTMQLHQIVSVFLPTLVSGHQGKYLETLSSLNSSPPLLMPKGLCARLPRILALLEQTTLFLPGDIPMSILFSWQMPLQMVTRAVFRPNCGHSKKPLFMSFLYKNSKFHTVLFTDIATPCHVKHKIILYLPFTSSPVDEKLTW